MVKKVVFSLVIPRRDSTQTYFPASLTLCVHGPFFISIVVMDIVPIRNYTRARSLRKKSLVDRPSFYRSSPIRHNDKRDTTQSTVGWDKSWSTFTSNPCIILLAGSGVKTDP